MEGGRRKDTRAHIAQIYISSFMARPIRPRCSPPPPLLQYLRDIVAAPH